MSNKTSRQILHPDDLVEGNRYSVLQEARHGYKRLVGTFVEMESEWCLVCQCNHLLIRLKRANGKIAIVCWNDNGIGDWREVN